MNNDNDNNNNDSLNITDDVDMYEKIKSSPMNLQYQTDDDKMIHNDDIYNMIYHQAVNIEHNIKHN